MAEYKVPVLEGLKIPPELLGGVGADATKFLRGDQTWAEPGTVSWQEEWDKHIQSGQIDIVGVRYATVYFLKPFNLVPKILLTMRDPTNKIVIINEITTTYFKLDMGNTATVLIDWMAIAR